MYRIDNSTAATALPATGAVGPTPNGFFTSGSPGTVAATIVDEDWANAVQEELCNAVTASGQTLSKTDRTQLTKAMAVPRVRPASALSAIGIFIGANYSDTKAAIFTAPVAGYVVAMAKLNLAGSGAAAPIQCQLLVNGVMLSTDTTLASQSHFCIAAVTAGESVQAQVNVNSGGTSPAEIATYGVTAFFVPYP
jgi:hypothetical protein